MSPPVHHERVLTTLNEDGTRHWIHPKLSRGRFLRRRKAVGYGLIALFVALPFLGVDLRFIEATDGLPLMLLGLTVALAVILLTALFGRVWCGWGCPQTVYLELVFRPIERWLEGSRGQRASTWRMVVKWILYSAVAFALSNVFLAYFVGVERLGTWVLGSPLDHIGGFLVVVATAALMLFDFGYFREQMCIVACPYGRLQSVLLDKQSLIVGYDVQRGEPRAKLKKLLPVLQDRGDCIDCGACVRTCPTGIDIRQGLQMECIGCTQCIDACDDVMDRIHKPRGLIGYTSQDVLDGKPRKLLRPRTIIYPLLLAVVAGLFAWSAMPGGDVTTIIVERIVGPSFVELPDGTISAQARVKIENESDDTRTYAVLLHGAPDAKLRAPQLHWKLGPKRSQVIPLFVDVPRASFVRGTRKVQLRISDDRGFARVVEITLLGPEGSRP